MHPKDVDVWFDTTMRMIDFLERDHRDKSFLRIRLDMEEIRQGMLAGKYWL